MKYTSSEANKLLRKMNADYSSLLNLESRSKCFLAASGEDPESVKPMYDYEKTQAELKDLAAKIRKVKHAVNMFNTTAIVPDFNMTIDEMLVYLPQLHERVNALDAMRQMLPKERVKTYGQGTNATIDYRYINYDLAVVKEDYEALTKELNNAQTALDLLNNTVTFEIDI